MSRRTRESIVLIDLRFGSSSTGFIKKHMYFFYGSMCNFTNIFKFHFCQFANNSGFFTEQITIKLYICNSYTMAMRDLPDIYPLARGLQAQGPGHIYQSGHGISNIYHYGILTEKVIHYCPISFI